MKRLLILVCFLVTITIEPHVLIAHGVTHELKLDEAAVITCTYDDGEPMSYAKVKIFAPGDQENEFQSGLTDGHGKFAFVPDRPGEWYVIVNDGMGHLVKGVINTRIGDADNANSDRETEMTPIKGGKVEKTITGLAIIWGFAGFAFYLMARKRRS